MPKMTDEFVNKIFLLEGGDIYTEDKDDKGGATKEGITLKTWQQVGYDKNHDGHIDKEDVKVLNMADLRLVMSSFWDTIKGDLIYNRSIAEIWFDWLWASGTWSIIFVQQILNVRDDGLVGAATIMALNNYPNQEYLFEMIIKYRIAFVKKIVAKDTSQEKWLQGWINRINSFKFSPNQ